MNTYLFLKNKPIKNTWKNKNKYMTFQLVMVIFQHFDSIYFA